MRDMVDLLVIGGGANGAGIARDAAGRGLSVLLVERGDLGGATSSASSKLIHGGLRYLEHYEFRLVREALAEREVLLRLAPHIVWPMRFVLPHLAEMRPRWMLRAGLFLYDHLAKRVTLPGSEALDFRSHPWGAPLNGQATHGFAYSDAWVEDARLVVLNARDAAARGAEIRVRTAFTAATRGPDGWSVTLTGEDGRAETVRARAIANAAGPWVMQALEGTGVAAPDRVRLVRGSHIVVPALYEGNQAYILQNDDRRVVFVIPYEGRFTLIGTTDVPHAADAGPPRCTPEEAAYLCRAVSRQFRKPVTPDDIVWTYSGVRPLYEDGASSATAATREYVLSLDAPAGQPAALHVFGGKITTYRRLAEDALAKLRPHLPGMGGPWTKDAHLPGGDFAPEEVGAKIAKLSQDYPFVDRKWAERMIRHYGTEAWAILGAAKTRDDLGRDFGATLTEAELRWLVDKEWARKVEDVIWRRTKLGLRLDADQVNSVSAWLEEHAG